MQTNFESVDVAVFWDYENCHASSQTSGYEVAANIRSAAHRFGSVKYFKAYMEIGDPTTSTSRSLSLRSELQSSGVSLTDCPHNGRKNVADQMIMVDMLAYAIDHPAPATLILISGDRDFAYAVATLRLRRYQVVVISLPMPGAHISLKSQASVCLDWNVDVMGYPNSSPRADSISAYQGPSSIGQVPAGRRPSYFGDRDGPFSVPQPEQPIGKPLPESHERRPIHPLASPFRETHPQGSPDLHDRPEVVPAPAYSTNMSPAPQKNGVEVANGLTPVISMANSLPPFCNSPEESPVMSPIAGTLLLEESIATQLPEGSKSVVLDPSPASSSRPATAPDAPAVTVASLPRLESANGQKLLAAFTPLVKVLEKHKATGVQRPLRSAVGYELVGLAKTVYKDAGVRNFGELAALAVKAKIVQLGGTGGKDWISLHPDWK